MTENVRNERESRETGRTLTPAGSTKIAGPPVPATNNFSNLRRINNPCLIGRTDGRHDFDYGPDSEKRCLTTDGLFACCECGFCLVSKEGK